MPHASRRRDPAGWAPVASLVMCVLLSMVYLTGPWFLDPITVWPFWLWTAFGLVVAVPGLFGHRRRFAAAAIAWLVATAIIAEEPRFLLRGMLGGSAEHARPDAITVVTVNCAGGQIEALRDALALDPDIIGVQERRGEEEMNELLAAHGHWQVAVGIDTAVCARGLLETVELHKHLGHYMKFATVRPERFPDLPPITVFSVHLNLPVLRWDLWRPSVWRQALHVRHVREESVRLLMIKMREPLQAGPVILTGDFNTPGQDSLLDPLRGELADAFVDAGSGWPDSVTADHPMSRIDGIWSSDELQATSARAVYTPHSDHRMVVARLAAR